jgi:hypothetical protein
MTGLGSVASFMKDRGAAGVMARRPFLFMGGGFAGSRIVGFFVLSFRWLVW